MIAEAAPVWQQYIAPAVIALLASVVAAFFAMRGTFRTAGVAREVEFDRQVDADRAALRAERDKLRADLEVMTADRDRYREMHAQLRLDVRAAGLNPDRLVPDRRGRDGDDAARDA
ncbi:hypothetical protein [Dactylosporangium fulvum]|uniref:Secreted protein n=1 Tax=Dactylosporangium fulvum TaxID=53359 RepID=A0ABY5W9H5_9ACTN|nr:hypothetical protein [Dactylosporangium fulvum]UWP85864.1 hypothetical protein Dfulv_17095 [Dactylosporangium fulvum]